MASNEKQQHFRLSTADGLKPLLYLNYLFGVSPFYVDKGGYLNFRQNSFTRFRALITAGLVAISASFSIYHMINILIWDKEERRRFTNTIDLTSRLISNLCPLKLICIGVFKADQFLEFLQELKNFNEEVLQFLDTRRVKRISRRVFVVQTVIITLSMSILFGRLTFLSSESKENAWVKVLTENGIQGWLFAGPLLVLVLAVMTLKYTAVAFLECFCIALATSFVTVIENLSEFITREVDVTGNAETIQPNKQAEIEHEEDRMFPVESHLTPSEKVCYAINKMETVSNMQQSANKIFSTLLLVDTGFSSVMVVLLKYLLIATIKGSLAQIRSNETDTELGPILYGGLIFLGFDICFATRIILLTKYLGKVNTASLNFNRVLGSLPKNVLERHIKGNCGDVGVNSIVSHNILAFLTVNCNQPIAFSAGGLFTFTSSTILVVISIVTTYVVFLLQA